MSKQIIYNPEARIKMLAGIDRVASVVMVTMGSEGPAVLIQHRTTGIMPVFTRDGVTVAKALSFDDRLVDLGARMLRDVASAVSRQVGDGTTTAIVLAQKLAQDCLKSVAAGFHPLQLKVGMDTALALVEKTLLEKAVTGVTPEWIEKISAVASKNELGVGQLLAEALEKLGTQGSLSFQLGNGLTDELDIVNGATFPQGYISPYFVTDKAREEAALENPYILFYDRDISDLMDLVPILEEVKAQGRSLLIIAENVIDKALTGLCLNHVRGIFKVVAVKPPGFGDKRINRLKDLALLTGGQAILDDYSSPKLEHVTLAQLGQAQRAVITAESTTIIGAVGDQTLVKERIETLKVEAEFYLSRKPGQGAATGNKHEYDELQDRIALLEGRTGVFQVGGLTDIEIKERLVRIENAYNSAKAALEEGVLPGGGVALYRCISALNGVIGQNSDQQQGLSILREALAVPLQTILHNSGLNDAAITAKLDQQADAHFTFDTHRQVFGNFLEIGIIDPVKVMRLALRNAVSVVGTMMTTEAVVMNVPDLSIMAGFSPELMAATREDPRV